MKLRNKKTGEILETARSSAVVRDKFKIFDENTNRYYTYDSLAELNAEWEDVPEEPKKTWFIDAYGNICDREAMTLKSGWCDKPLFEFDTREEADLAVRKLKAWKRLKDKGFRFLPEASFIQQKNDEGESIGSISFTMDDEDDYIWGNNKDLDLLFGGGAEWDECNQEETPKKEEENNGIR